MYKPKFFKFIKIIITKTMFMVLSSWQSHCESSPGSFDECRMAPSGRRPKTKPDDLCCESACTGCQKLHPPSPFIIIITQPESWYSFYRPTGGRRLSRPSWLVTYRDGFIPRLHNTTRDIGIVIPSVRPFVCHAPILYWNGWIYHHTSFCMW